jgi:hypothetical protein
MMDERGQQLERALEIIDRIIAAWTACYPDTPTIAQAIADARQWRQQTGETP